MAYPAIINYLKLWKTGDNGLVQARRGNWHWFDHLGNQDKTVMENCWYYAALKSARRMADLTGNAGNNEWLDSRIAAIEKSFDQAFWKSAGYQADCLDERANALAVVFGLAGKD
ncbi:MAG: glycoside hydrolase family 78, partial [Nitrospinaceae bacterium]|nr:glycoside hydrolase family 78 [Nitrospinaceae bacterium]